MDMDELLVLAENFGSWDLLESDHKELFESSSYGDVQQDVASIQSQREITKTMMNMKRIHPFLAGMAHLEKVLTTIKFQHTTKVMSYIWGPVRFLLKTTNPAERAFDSVLNIYERLGNKLPLLYEYIQLFTGLPESQQCLIDIYRDVVMFHRLIYRLFSLRTSLWQQLYKPTWKALSHTFEYLLGSVELYAQFFQAHASSLRNLEANLDQVEELPVVEFGQNLTQDWDGIKIGLYRHFNDLNRRRADFKEAETARKEAEKRKVIKWISASTKTQSLHKEFQRMRICPNTGRWLFRRYSEVTDWMKEDQPPEVAIWLQGSRGFGKTVLTSLLIDELKDLCTEKKKYAIPPRSKPYYFYCQEEDPEHRTYLAILKGILHQMVEFGDDVLPLCVEKADSSEDLATTEIVQTLIAAFFEYDSRQYVIIDGLDECESLEDKRKTATFFLGQVAKCEKRGQLRVLFMSQPMPELAKGSIMPEGNARVQLKSTDNADDIRAYVQKRIPDFSKEHTTGSGFNLSDGDRQQLESIICRRSEDMFLYANLAIEYLLHQPTKGTLLEKIKEEMLPKGLSQIYERLLGAIKTELLQLAEGEAHWQMAKLLLGWLVCAKRPLKWHEMQSIQSYDPVKQIVDFDNKMLRQNASKYLGSLVHVIDGTHIRIIHSTARRYIRFSGLSFYENLCLLWNHIYTHQKGTLQVRDTIGIAQLDTALVENRAVLQKFIPSSKAWLNDTIEDYYGPNLFKCKRLLCKFFYLGYNSENDLNTHDARHDRPYQCPVNCGLALLGFSSKKDRERHVRVHHPDLNDGPSIFEALQTRVTALRFTCAMCGNMFTRRPNLKSHERTHFGERPYTCSHCPKSFTRFSDCRRHEKTHSKKGR